MAITAKTTIEIYHNGETYLDLREQLQANDKQNQLNKLRKYLRKMAGGTANPTTLSVTTSTGAAAKASGTVTVSGTVSADDVITLQGVALTAKASPANEAQWQASTTKATAAASLASVINAHSTLSKIVSASASSATNPVVTITALQDGTLGNSITLVKTTGTNLAVSGATFSGGVDGVSNTIKTFLVG